MTLPVRLPALLILLSVNAQAWAGTSSVRLSYERGAGAEGCPDEQHLKDAVAARLGYDPFAEWGDRTVQAKVESKNGVERVGTVHMLASDGKVLGSLKRSSKATDCSELAAAMELAITIAIDPLVLSRPEPPPPPPPPPAKPEVEARPPPPPNLGEVRTVEAEAPPPVPTRRIPTEISVLAGPIVFTGAPRIGVGLNLGLELKWEQFSLGLEGRADLPAGTDVGRGGAVTTWAASGALVPCVRWSVLGLCGLGAAGVQGGYATNLSGAKQTMTPLLEVGARAVANLEVIPAFSFRFFVDARVPIARTTLTVRQTSATGVEEQLPVWSSPPVAAVFGISAVGHLGR